MQYYSVCTKRLRKRKSTASQILEASVKHHVYTIPANCFWMQFAGTSLPNTLCKYAKWCVVGVDKHERMCGEREGREWPKRGLFTPQPLETQNPKLSTLQCGHVSAETVGRRRQTACVRMFGCKCTARMYVCVCVWRDSVCVCVCQCVMRWTCDLSVPVQCN